MPNPQKGEKQSDYIGRCVGELVNSEGYKADQAAAICHSKWEKAKAAEALAEAMTGRCSECGELMDSCVCETE